MISLAFSLREMIGCHSLLTIESQFYEKSEFDILTSPCKEYTA